MAWQLPVPVATIMPDDDGRGFQIVDANGIATHPDTLDGVICSIGCSHPDDYVTVRVEELVRLRNALTAAAHTAGGHVGTAKAAALLGKSPATVKRLAKSGELPYLFKMDGETGAYVFSRAVLAAYLKARK